MTEIGKIQPQNIELEELILAQLILEPKAIYKVSDSLRGWHFYRDSNSLIYSVLFEKYKNGEDCDLAILANELKKQSKLDEIGGPLYLAKLTSKIASSGHLESHVEILIDLALKRKAIEFNAKLESNLYDESLSFSEISDEINTGINELYDLQTVNSLENSYELTKALLADYDERARRSANNESIGVETGLADLNKLIIGYMPGDLIILAARPSVGKTAMAISKVIRQLHKGFKVGFISIEMTSIQLMYRLAASVSGINIDRFKTGKLTEKEIIDLQEKSQELSEYSLYINDSVSNLSDIIIAAKKLKQKHDIDVLFMDYLQIIQAKSKSTYNRENEVANISLTLKQLAKQLNIPLIALCQLNRSLENRTDKKPKLSDLRESGAIEQDADLVEFIHRGELFNEEDEEENMIIVAKNRNGNTGEVKFKHSGNMIQIYDYSKKDFWYNEI